MSTVRGQQRGAVKENGVSLRRGKDNEYNRGQQRGEVYGLMWNGALAVHSLLFSGITPFGGMVAEDVASGGGVRCAH